MSDYYHNQAGIPKKVADVSMLHVLRMQDRFWLNADVRGLDECWEWRLSKMSNGYGVACVGKARVAAHRVAYMIACGKIPSGLDLDHLCRNRACVNPRHLEPVSRGVNLRRSALTGPGRNAAKTHCDKGHDLAVTASVAIDKNGVKHRLCRVCHKAWRAGVCVKFGKSKADVRRHAKTCRGMQ